MQLIEALYVTFSATLTLAGLSMVGTAVRAYQRTMRRDMIHLSIGFGLVVSATVGTAISAFLTGFERPRTILTVNSLTITVGFLFVMYSLTQE